jgi:bacillithiol biosynthesis cysteine-adding enzyme BshC
MRINSFANIDFRKLNALVRDYCRNNAGLHDFFEIEPSIDAIACFANNLSFSLQKYNMLHQVLSDQYAKYVSITQVNENILSFSKGEAVCVTTGHQLCLLGGPAYFFYKIISAIKLAQELQSLVPTKRVVPVFWLASEDHDKEEINHMFHNGVRVEWNTTQTGAVGQFSLGGFEEVLKQWLGTVEDQNTRESISRMFTRAMQCSTWADLTQSWVHECFGEWGLVVINPDDPRLKRLFAPMMKRELLQSVAHSCVIKTNEKLGHREYNVQVNPREINLFYLSPQSRVRIERVDDVWQTTDALRKWTELELMDELDKHPENFSPNVLLRPIYQETILPNVAYVGGPGELAYWLQLRELFAEFNGRMPAIVLRDSAIMLSQASSNRLSKLGLKTIDLFRDKHELIVSLVGEKPDFSNEKEELLRLFEQLAERIGKVEPTLRATAMADAKRALTGIDQLQGKTWKALKLKEEQKLIALEKIWEEVYPSNDWQERSQNIFKEIISNDKELIRQLLSAFQPPQSTVVILEN